MVRKVATGPQDHTLKEASNRRSEVTNRYELEGDEGTMKSTVRGDAQCVEARFG
jgi:hypothetical protein